MAKKKLRTRRMPGILRSAQEKLKEEPVVVCSDIEKLTFDKFIKCMVDSDLTVLRVSGIPTGTQLFMAWINILSEHYRLIGSMEQEKQIKTMAKMEALNLKITVVTAICTALYQWLNPKLTDCLRVWGYKFQFTGETLLKDLERVMVDVSNDNFKLEKLKHEWELKEKQKNRKGQKTTKEIYMRMLYEIEKFRNMRYPPDKITLYEFDMFYNELIEYNEVMRAQETKRNSYNKNKNP